MWRLIVAMLVLALLAAADFSQACVGKTLYVGIVDGDREQLLAELVSQLVTERTGTTVKVLVYRDSRELYGAVRQGKVGLVIENTDRAMEMLGKARGAGGKGAYDLTRAEYRKSLNLVWLDPFGTVAGEGGPQLFAPVITTDILGNLPALPKLLQKLAGVANDASFGRLLKAVMADEKPKKVARDYLKAKKLI